MTSNEECSPELLALMTDTTGCVGHNAVNHGVAISAKSAAFFTKAERDTWQDESMTLFHSLGQLLGRNSSTVEEATPVLASVGRYVGAYGYRRVPHTISMFTNMLQRRVHVDETDFGKDVTLFVQTEKELPKVISNRVVLYIYTYNLKVRGVPGVPWEAMEHYKTIPFTTLEAKDAWVVDTEKLVHSMISCLTTCRRTKDLPSTYIMERYQQMSALMHRFTAYVNKWSKGRVPANLRKHYHLYQHVLGQLPFLDFGHDLFLEQGQKYEKTSDEVAAIFAGVPTKCFVYNSE